jgi:tRNA pseudouridine55 synthase
VQFKRIKRPVSGVLLLDKPAGFSSNQALQRVKNIYQAAKAGHTGNLDPFATGLLPICFGEATKFSHTLLDADKGYRAIIKLGIVTTTGDIEGDVVSQRPVSVTKPEVERVLAGFVGEITQIPPMHSALKHQGKPLYEYARAGVEIERKPRQVMIYRLALIDFRGDELEIEVACSKGTYIRVLGEDIGAKLGYGGHLTLLRRLETGGFRLEEAYTLEALEKSTREERDARLLAVDALLADMPEIELDADSAFYLCQGQSVWKAGISSAPLLRAYGPARKFLGLVENLGDGRVKPKRLLSD